MRDLVGQTFGFFTVLENEAPSNDGRKACKCVCACGRVLNIRRSSLTTGNTRSCGCKHSELCGNKLLTHGDSRKGKHTSEYRSWSHILDRCNNPSSRDYPRYGGRGIKICESWLVYSNFLADMGRKPDTGYSIERVDNNGNYSPTNCRWATKQQQAENRRTTRLITLNGETRATSYWLRVLQIPRSTYEGRRRRGYTPEQALTLSR
jgi:hypothetical protein